MKRLFEGRILTPGRRFNACSLRRERKNWLVFAKRLMSRSAGDSPALATAG